MLGISYRERKPNDYVWQQVSILGGPQQLLLSTVKRPKLSWFGPVCRHDTLPKIILQGSSRTEGVAEVFHVNRGRTTSNDILVDCLSTEG